jgi:uncharacterized protein (TIGR02145 family)
MKKSLFKTQICAIALSILAISCEKLEEIVPTSEKMMIETLVPIDINERGVTFKANVISAGSSEIQAIGFVYWDPNLFDIDLNLFFDTTTMFPGDFFLGIKSGEISLGTVGGDVGIDTINGEIFLSTVGGDVGMGTVGGDVGFPSEFFLELLEKIKIINKNKKGEFSADAKQLKFNTKYAVRALIANKEGIVYAKSQVFESWYARIKTGEGVTDISGNTYPSVIINGLEWMAENLKTDKYADKTPVSTTNSSTVWLEDTIGLRQNPNRFIDESEDYGYLYNWYATQNSSGLCPDGWRIPTKNEWDDLVIYLGGANVAGNTMKTKGTEWWKDQNEDATNSSGFSVRGAGSIGESLFASGFNNYAMFWSNTQIGTTSEGFPIPEHYKFSKENGIVLSNNDISRTPNAKAGASIRCVKD